MRKKGKLTLLNKIKKVTIFSSVINNIRERRGVHKTKEEKVQQLSYDRGQECAKDLSTRGRRCFSSSR
jgi:hypothetical protein